jgi:uncharacterized membrane protein YbaN (DUF454 family)
MMGGILCVALGYVGILIPGMPSTVFFICALWAFKRSSPRFESWLLNHPVFGSVLRDWEERKVISPRIKAIAITSLVVCVGISVLIIHSEWAKVLVLVMAAVGVAVIATRKSG